MNLSKAGRPPVFTGELKNKIGQLIAHQGGNLSHTRHILTAKNGANLKEISALRKAFGFTEPLRAVTAEGVRRPISLPTLRTIATDLGLTVVGRGRPRKVA